MLRHSALAATLLLASPALAGDFTPPEGCETFLTVQKKACGVSLMWRCDATPNRFWEASFSAEGLESIVSYDDDYQWIDARYTWDDSIEEYLPPAVDPISVSTLLRTGIDTYDFTMRRTEGKASSNIRIIGADQLSGQVVTIDGVDLDVVMTRMEIRGERGEVQYQSRGKQYYAREFGQFFLWQDHATYDDGSTATYDDAPIDFIRPGEAGFGATTPLYECDQLDAGFAPAAPSPALKEMTDDKV